MCWICSVNMYDFFSAWRGSVLHLQQAWLASRWSRDLFMCLCVITTLMVSVKQQCQLATIQIVSQSDSSSLSTHIYIRTKHVLFVSYWKGKMRGSENDQFLETKCYHTMHGQIRPYSRFICKWCAWRNMHEPYACIRTCHGVYALKHLNAQNVYMYMYACTYACIYACMYLYTYAWLHTSKKNCSISRREACWACTECKKLRILHVIPCCTHATDSILAVCTWADPAQTQATTYAHTRSYLQL